MSSILLCGKRLRGIFKNFCPSNWECCILQVDESGRIAAYVDFSELDAALAAMSATDREALELELEPRRDFETISEERETPGVASSVSPTSLVG